MLCTAAVADAANEGPTAIVSGCEPVDKERGRSKQTCGPENYSDRHRGFTDLFAARRILSFPRVFNFLESVVSRWTSGFVRDILRPGGNMTRKRPTILIGIVAALAALYAAAVGSGITSSRADEAGIEVGVGDLRGEILSLFAPLGAIATETNPNYKGAAAPAPAAPPSPAAADWPSYNKTLTSERFSDLSQINTKNVAKLKVLCTYDTWRLTAFETGLIMVEGALIGTTEFDIFSINPSTCAENWRSHEEYPAYILPTNRGAAYLDGMLFRGTDDGRVLAYDFKTGKRLWETTNSGSVTKGESCARGMPKSPGRASSSSAMPAATSRAARGACTRSTPRPARSCGNSILCPRSKATRSGAGLRAPRRSTRRPGRTFRVLRSVVAEPGLLRPWTQPLGFCMCPSVIPRRTSTTASRQGVQSLHRLRRCPRRQNRRLQEPFPACAQRLARLGRLQPAGSDQDHGGQEADGGVAEGRTPLRF